ncbi:MAG: protoporphyrinogen oxidase [Bacillota bacterium]
MKDKKYQVVIVGGGITGLSAAYYLQKSIKRMALPVSFTLIEANPRLGGKIQTFKKDKFIIEKGPDSFLKRKTSTIDLIKELGLENELISNETSKAYILKKAQLHPIPEDALMGVPTRITPFMKSRLLTFKGKARAACDLILPKSVNDSDQSVGQFFRRRLGNELVDYLIEPLLSGIYASDIDQLSLKSTFPHFQKIEAEHRSLILGMRTMRPQKRESQFLTLKRGLGSLVQAIEEQLSSKHIILEESVQEIEKIDNKYELSLSMREKIIADAVILAIPHQNIGQLLNKYDFIKKVNSMPSTTIANVALCFSESQLPFIHEGTGFVVSKKENYTITACTWTNKKWPHTTPSGKVLLRCYVGRPGNEGIVNQPDHEIIEAVLKDLKRIMGVKGDPEFYHITRWRNAMPQYRVGQKEWLESLRENLQFHLPHIHIAGASYEGIGIGDCILQGRESVETVLQELVL